MSLLPGQRLARRLSGWLLVALMLATLAPAISRTLAGGLPQDGRDRVELCTAEGMQWVPLAAAAPDTSPDSSESGSSALDLCGHCTLAAERFAPLLPSLPFFDVVVSRWDTPAHRGIASRSTCGPHPAARDPPLLMR